MQQYLSTGQLKEPADQEQAQEQQDKREEINQVDDKKKMSFELKVSAQIAGTAFQASIKPPNKESSPPKKAKFYNGSFQMRKEDLLVEE